MCPFHFYKIKLETERDACFLDSTASFWTVFKNITGPTQEASWIPRRNSRIPPRHPDLKPAVATPKGQYARCQLWGSHTATSSNNLCDKWPRIVSRWPVTDSSPSFHPCFQFRTNQRKPVCSWPTTRPQASNQAPPASPKPPSGHTWVTPFLH